MEGYQVTTLDDMVKTGDIFVTATGNTSIITAAHMAQMKDKAIVGNIGHFDNEIDMAGLKKVNGIRRIQIKPQYDEYVFPDGHSRSEEHTSELQSRGHLVCRLLLEKK